MRKSITLRAFPSHMDTLARVRLAQSAGFEGIELNLEPSEEYTLDCTENELKSLLREVQALGMSISSVYSRQQWLHPITSRDRATRGLGQAIVERLAWACSIVGTDAVLVVPGAVDNSVFAPQPEIVPYQLAYERSQAALREMASKVGERYGVYLAVENVWNKFLLSPLELARFVDEIDSPWVGVYFDVGNVLRTGFPEHWIPILGTRIKRVHFKDFRLSVDNTGGFVGLLEGDVNWPAVREALYAIEYSSWVTAEVLPAYRHHGERLIYDTSASMDAILGAW